MPIKLLFKLFNVQLGGNDGTYPPPQVCICCCHMPFASSEWCLYLGLLTRTCYLYRLGVKDRKTSVYMSLSLLFLTFWLIWHFNGLLWSNLSFDLLETWTRVSIGRHLFLEMWITILSSYCALHDNQCLSWKCTFLVLFVAFRKGYIILIIVQD